MTYQEFEERFQKEMKPNYKTADIDVFIRKLVKEKANVSFLKDKVLEKQNYHRIYFYVTMKQIKDKNERLAFIEDNFELLQDWWHVDQLCAMCKDIDFDLAFSKATKYITSELPYVRRWGYVLFISNLYKDEENYSKIFPLFKDDDAYHVQMAEAWLLSYLGICHPQATMDYLKTCGLNYNIVGKAIQKVCDSYRVDKEIKESFKEIRKLYKD